MTDENPLRAAHEQEQQEMENEMLTEKERNDWLWSERQKDIEADLRFNFARTDHTLATAEYLRSKAAFWSGLSVGLFILYVLVAIAAIITGIKVIW